MKSSHSCLTAVALLAASSRLWAVPTQIAQESFEGTGGSIGYTTSVPEFIETATSAETDYFSVITNNGTKIEGARTLASADGTKIFCAEDIDTARTSPASAVPAQQSLTTNSVNIAGKINNQVRIKLAAPGLSSNAAVYENFTNAPTAIDFVMVEVSIDGGAFQRIAQFSPSVSNVSSTLTFDSNGDFLGDSVANPLTAAFQDFTYSIPTGSTVAVKVTMHSNGTGEYIAVDDIRIFGESAATNPPVIAGVPAGNLVFTEGGSAAPVAPALTVTDSDSANLTSASVVISQGLATSEDVLAATPSGALAAGNIVYTAATGTLAITGSAPLADYQAVLRSVTYQNTNATNPSTAVRRLTFVANDGSNPSNSPFRDVNVIDNINTQILPFTESFETDGRGTRYSVDGGFSNPPSMFARVQPGAIGGLDGSFAFGVENVDDNTDPTELVTFKINAGGASGLTGELRVAAGGGAVYDNNAPTPDFLTLEVSADGGAFQNVLAFYSDAGAQGNLRQDTTPADSNNVGDGTQLTSALQTFNFTLPTATTLTVRIHAFTNIAGENILFDRLVINGPPPPTVASISSSATNGAHKIGDVIPVDVTFSSAVNVTGTPQLTLETGATDRVVNFTSGSGTTTLTFNYTVQAGDVSSDLDYLSTSALALNGGSIASATTATAAFLTLPSPGAAGSLGANKALVIDGVVPTVASVSSSTANGTYKIGDTLAITVNFSEAVTVTGTPQLTLETGTTDRIANYVSGSGSTSLTFNYTVQAGDASADLDYVSTSALALNSGSIKDPAGNDATLTLPTPGAAGSLGANKALVIDGVRPTLASAIGISDTNLQIGETATVTFTFTEAITGFTTADVTAPNATLSSLGSSNGGITWTATLTPTANTLAPSNVLTLDLTGIADIAGNSGTGSATSGNYAVDTTSADLSITKTDGVTTAVPGGSVTYTITASNAGPNNVTGATVADTLPASLTGVTWTAVGAGGGTVPASGSGNINASVNLPVGGSVTFTVSATVSAAATGSLTNTATVSSSVFDPTAGNNSATDTDTLTPQADLAITKTDGVTTATPGGSVTYTITASNPGPSNITGATLADTFPASLTGTWTAVGAGGGTAPASGSGNINASVNLPVGGSVTFTVSATISAAATGSLSNTATIATPGGATDPTPGNNSATDTDTLAPQADLAITKTDGVTTATAGGSVTYTITASNAGPSNVSGATVADTLPATISGATWTGVGAGGGTGPASGSGNISASTINLPAGGSFTFTVTAPISSAATGTLSNTATVAAPGGVTDPTPGNNSATDSDTITQSADLAITKTDGVTTAIAGGSVTYTITASNAGPSNATGVTVADTLPASISGATWTGVGAGGGTGPASGSGNINATSINLPAGGSFTFTVTAPISAAATGSLANTATVSSAVTDSTPANNSATDTDTITQSADLAITKTDGVTTVTAGGSTTYTITASNPGPSNITGATLADTLPASLTGVTWTAVGAGGGTAPASGSGNINASVNLPVGGSVTFTVSATVSPAATGSLSNTATIATPGGATDPTPGNNSATDTDTIALSADLAITKTDGVTTATAGGSVTYTITASNAGPSNASGVTVADTLPASISGATWTGVGAGGGTGPASGSGNISASTINLPAGGSFTFTVTAPISSAATGTLSNTATVAAPGGVTDPTPGNNSATDTDTITQSADLAITKTDGVTTATPGGSVTYTITASNAGPSNITGATLADTFPASLTGTWTAVGAGGGTAPPSGSGNINASVNLPVGGSVTFTVSTTISPAATGTLSNTATIAVPGGATDPTPANNSATDTDTLVPQANLAITKTDGMTTATPGGSVTYTITASNAGPSNVTSATVADTLPASLTGTWTAVGAGGGTATASGSGNINDTVNLPAGGSVTYTVTATISPAATSTLSNTATVSSSVTDPTPANNSATDTDTLVPQANLAVTISDSPDPANAGSDLTYTINLTNNGPSDAASTAVNLPLPASTTFASSSAPGGWSTTAPAVGTNGTVIFNIANLSAGGTAAFTVVAKLDLTVVNDSTLTATVTTSSSATDPTPGNNSATTTTLAKSGADLQIALTDSPDPVIAGTELTYTIDLINNGPLDANSASVTDTLPAGTTFVSLTTPAGWSATTPAVGGTGAVTITRPLLANAGTASFTLVVKVDPNVADGNVLSNTASASSSTLDHIAGNNSGTASTTVNTRADLAIGITAAPTTVNKGANVTYTLTLANNGPSDAKAPAVTLPIPAQMTFVSVITPAGWTATTPAVGGTGNVSFTRSSLALGGTATFKVVAKASSSAANGTVLTAIASVSGGDVDPNTANNSASATAAVGTINPSPLQIGTTGTLNSQNGLFELTVNVTNTTPLPINGFRLHVDYSAYKANYPSLRLYNASSPANSSDVYVDYPFPVAVDATVAMKLSFYTSTRTFPSPFKPKLTVEKLAASQVPSSNGNGVQPRIVRKNDGTILLEFPSVIGRWYRVSFTNDLTHWYDSPVPIKASTTQTQIIDSGAPLTNVPPSQSPMRFYKVNEINAP